jgi:N-acetylmuramoyl-L-alanine amidase
MNQPANDMKDGMEAMAFMDGRPTKFGLIALTMFVFCMLPLTAAGAPRPGAHLVLIDPAHGGEDSGVVSDKLREKDLTLKLAILIRQEANKMPDLQVQLTRSSDRRMTIAERIKAVGTTKADCLISLHVNAGFGKKATGYEIYFPGFQQEVSGGKDSSPIIKDMTRNKSLNDSVRLAQQIQSGLETVLPRKGRGLREAPSPLLDALTIPGLVVEIGFATHPDDRKKLTGPETQKAIANAVVKGLQNYFSSLP